jgi:hypothetical protein
MTPSTNLLNRIERMVAVESRACGFVLGVIVCALLVALLYFGLQWALSGVPE